MCNLPCALCESFEPHYYGVDDKEELLLQVHLKLLTHTQEEGTLIDHDDEQKFLSIADFLASHSLPALINNMHAAAAESLKRLLSFFIH